MFDQCQDVFFIFSVLTAKDERSNNSLCCIWFSGRFVDVFFCCVQRQKVFVFVLESWLYSLDPVNLIVAS